MSRLRGVAAAAVAVICVVAPTASAHKGDPNFISEIRAVAPAVEGLSVEVVDRDDSLELRNRSDRTVVVEGYDGEPYARIAADGTVAVNRRSSAYYLNEDRFAEGIEVPASARGDAPPDWRVVDRTGRFAWHDHRIHWMSRTVPPQVEDETERTKVLDWKVPLRVGGEPAVIDGTLTWVGRPADGFPLAAALSLVGVVALGAALVVWVRRRRADGGSPPGEAW